MYRKTKQTLENMRNEIQYQWKNPISGDFDNAHLTIERLLSSGCAKRVSAKGSFWNTGHMAFDTKLAYKIYNRSGDFCTHVIEIWYRNDGFHNRAFKYDTEEIYDNYVDDCRTPHAIANEIGMEEN